MTLRDLCNWCDEAGIDWDTPLHLATGPGTETYVLSVYKSDDGTQGYIDIGDE